MNITDLLIEKMNKAKADFAVAIKEEEMTLFNTKKDQPVKRPHLTRIVAASINDATGARIFTYHLRYWRAIHAELMTHRVFSRNAGSSRAKPVKKVLQQAWNDPAGPQHWGSNQPGMQAGAELTGWRLWAAKKLWAGASKAACFFAWGMMKIGLHKQVANRALEPYQYIDVLVTSTEWQNFFDLRCHKDAQPEFQSLARDMAWEMTIYKMDEQNARRLKPGEWHLPYVLDEERSLPLNLQLALSTARCARVSYEPFDGNASHEKELERFEKLVGSEPRHASPCEHQAMAAANGVTSRNFTGGWIQHRMMVENKIDAEAISAAVLHADGPAGN